MKWLQGLRWKIGLLIFIPSLTLSMIGFSAVQWLRQRGDRVERLSILQMNRLRLTAEMQRRLQGMLGALSGVLDPGEDRSVMVTAYRKEREAFEHVLRDSRRLPSPHGDLFRRFDDSWPVLRKDLDEVASLLGKGPDAERKALALFRGRAQDGFHFLQEGFSEISRDQLESSTRQASAEISSAYESALRMLVLTAGGIFALIIAGFLFLAGLEKDLARVARELGASSLDSSLLSTRLRRLFGDLKDYSTRQPERLRNVAVRLRHLQDELLARQGVGEGLLAQIRRNLRAAEEAEKNLEGLMVILAAIADTSPENQKRLENALALGRRVAADLGATTNGVRRAEEVARAQSQELRAPDLRSVVEALESAAARSSVLAEDEWGVEQALTERLQMAEGRLRKLLHGRAPPEVSAGE